MVYSVHVVDVKRRVLTAAKRLYAKKGYAGLSMRKVAEAAGVSTMATYRHYENKDHLLHELQVYAFSRYTAKYLRPLLEIEDPWEALRGCLSAYCRFALDDGAYFKIAFMATDEIQTLKELTAEGKATIEEAFRIPLQITANAVGEEHALAETTRGWFFMHGMVALHLAGRLRFMNVDFDTYVEAELDRYHATMRATFA